MKTTLSVAEHTWLVSILQEAQHFRRQLIDIEHQVQSLLEIRATDDASDDIVDAVYEIHTTPERAAEYLMERLQLRTES